MSPLLRVGVDVEGPQQSERQQVFLTQDFSECYREYYSSVFAEGEVEKFMKLIQPN